MKNALCLLMVSVSLLGCGVEVSGTDQLEAPDFGQVTPPGPNPIDGPDPAPPIPATCWNISGRYVVYNTNIVEHFVAQDGCGKVTFSFRCVFDDTTCKYAGYPKDDSAEYALDGIEHEVKYNLARDFKTYSKGRYEGDSLILETRTVSTSGTETKAKHVYSHAARPCNLMNPEPGKTYLVKKSYDEAGNLLKCDYRVKLN